VSFSRARLDSLLARCGDAWLPNLLPEDLSMRWWLLGGAIVCDTASSFSRAPIAGKRRSSTGWGQQRLEIAALHLSDARRARLQSYLERVVPDLDTTVPVALVDMRTKLFEVRERDDDWYAARFGFEVFGRTEATVAVGG
jgi:hypothetical protein